jgi:hypothetical protein
VGRVAFKKGATPLDGSHAFALPSCFASFHLPSPLDGERPHCFRLAVVGGAQLRGSWYLSATAQLQGFSSGSLAASPCRWSPKTVTTSLMVGRSKPGCGLCPALSFQDLHHPCWGGGRAKPELYIPHGFVGHLLLQHSGERALTGLAEGADFDNAGPSGRKRRQLQHAWFTGSAGSGMASGATSHRWAECGYLPAIRAAVAPRAPGDRPRCRALLGRRSCSWVVLPLLRHNAFARRSVLARPGGLELGSAAGQAAAVVGAEVVAAGEVLVADKIAAAIRAPGLGSLALIACPRPSSGDMGEGLIAAASALRSSLLLFGRSERRSLSLLPEWAAASHLGFCLPAGPPMWGLFVPAEVEPEFRCNGTLSVGVCSLWLSGPEHLCIWA